MRTHPPPTVPPCQPRPPRRVATPELDHVLHKAQQPLLVPVRLAPVQPVELRVVAVCVVVAALAARVQQEEAGEMLSCRQYGGALATFIWRAACPLHSGLPLSGRGRREEGREREARGRKHALCKAATRSFPLALALGRPPCTCPPITQHPSPMATSDRVLKVQLRMAALLRAKPPHETHSFLARLSHKSCTPTKTGHLHAPAPTAPLHAKHLNPRRT